MKVRVTLTVDIDPASWEANYGVAGAAAIREDVDAYIRHTVHETLRDNDLLLP